MPNLERIKLLSKTTVVESESALIESLLLSSGTTTIGFINQHGYNLCNDADTYDAFMNLDVMLRDGIGMKMALNLFGIAPGANMNGTDLIPKLAQQALQKPLNVMAFGTEEPWLSKGINNLGLAESCSVVHHGFETQLDVYVNKVVEHHTPDVHTLIVLAMGMPKQEQLAAKIKRLNLPQCTVICGGAILDFQADKVKRAPKLFRQTGMEWAYRLLSEPRRMFNRYVVGIPIFLGQLIRMRVASNKLS
jgi:exopolysaccharide biosynthesis WecB/TagA/CpsF family protein